MALSKALHRSTVQAEQTLCQTAPSSTAKGAAIQFYTLASLLLSSLDECSDSHGPPTFSIYCGTRVDTRRESESIDDPGRGRSSHATARQSRGQETARSTSIAESPSIRISSESYGLKRFETPSDFEYTGDVAEDCRRLERLEREFYGLSTSPEFTSDLEKDVNGHKPKRRVHVPALKMGHGLFGKQTKNSPPPACSILESREEITKRSVIDAEGTVTVSVTKSKTSVVKTRHSGGKPPSKDQRQKSIDKPSPPKQSRPCEVISRHASPAPKPAHISPILQPAAGTPGATWVRSRSSLSGFRTPSDFEYTGDVDEDVKKLEILERKYYGESTPTYSGSELDEDSMLGSRHSIHVAALERSVPKLNIPSSQSVPLFPKVDAQCHVRASAQTDTTASRSPEDEANSSFSWMQLSTKESISESEFAMLLNGTREKPDPKEQTDPYEATRAERYVYADVALRSVWVEILLEGMLLEYNTRPARDHDTHLVDIERVIKFVPEVLRYHLDHDISKPVITRLKKKLSFQAPNINRLLRLLTSSLFPVELYAKREHIARGAFAHVFRCGLPLLGKLSV